MGKKTLSIPDVNKIIQMLQNDHPEHQRQKKTKVEINFKREIKVKIPILFFAKIQEMGYFYTF